MQGEIVEARELPSERQDVRLELRIKNSVLWHAIYDRYESIAELCRRVPILTRFYQGIVDLVAFRRSPLGKDGQYREECVLLEGVLGIAVEDLFPRTLYERITGSVRVLEVSSFSALPSVLRKELRLLPAPSGDPVARAERAELREQLAAALRTLRGRECSILEWRHGFSRIDFVGDIPLSLSGAAAGLEPLTYDQIEQRLHVSKERVRQIERRALLRVFRFRGCQLIRSFLGTSSAEAMSFLSDYSRLTQMFSQFLELCGQ